MRFFIVKAVKISQKVWLNVLTTGRVDTVNLYMAGLMDKATALRRLSEHQPNNQMCLLNQEIADKFLTGNKLSKNVIYTFRQLGIKVFYARYIIIFKA